MNQKQKALVLLGKCLCFVSFLDPLSLSLHLSVLWKKTRVCHRGACYRILCVLFVTQQSFSLKCEPALVCSFGNVCVCLCVGVCIWGCICVPVCICGYSMCMYSILWTKVWYLGYVCVCKCHVTVCEPLYEYVLFALVHALVCVCVVEPWELGRVSAVCSSSEGELLCFSALCWIPFQLDTIPQLWALSCSLHSTSTNPLCSHTHPDHRFSTPGPGRCARLQWYSNTLHCTVLWCKVCTVNVCFNSNILVEIFPLLHWINQWHFPCPQSLTDVRKYELVLLIFCAFA